MKKKIEQLEIPVNDGKTVTVKEIKALLEQNKPLDKLVGNDTWSHFVIKALIEKLEAK